MFTPALLTLLALNSTLHADQLVEGEALRVYYDGNGYWNDYDAYAGLQALHDDTWVDWTYPGNPYMVWSVAFSEGDTDSVYYAHSYYYGTNMTVDAETDASNTVAKIATYDYTAGSLELTRTESWLVAGRVMRVEFTLTNNSSSALTGLELFYAADPDADYAAYGNYYTFNDTIDVDGDGSSDWVESVASDSGYTLGFGACDPANTSLGHFASWSYVYAPGTALTDEEGIEADDAMGWDWSADDELDAGETLSVRLLVVVADTAAEAEEGWLASAGYCALCDDDGDDADMDICGGDDCEPDNSEAYPGAPETWYDGVDGDCSGGSDYDADGDGYDSEDYGGDDCDDTSAVAIPGGTETWYDGIDGDCSGGSDYDADGDGHDSDDYGGTDCEDDNAEINPDTSEIWYDGTDSDCSGGSDYDADGDEHDSDLYGGDDCDDANATVYPGASEVYYDGEDENCSGSLDEYDADGDGQNAEGYGGQDCDDNDASIYPGADDPAGDGIDQGCDGDDTGTVDSGDTDETGGDTGETGGDDTSGEAETGEGEIAVKGGCGCASAPASGTAWGWVGLIGLLGVWRRKRAPVRR